MSESLEKLRNRILADARVKAEDTIREAEKKAEQISEEARVQAQKEAEAIATKSRLEAEALRRSILSSRIRANRLRVLDEKNRIVQTVLRTLEETLSSLTATDRFQDTLKRFVAEGIEAVGSEQPIVRVGFREATKKDFDLLGKALPKGTKLVVEEGVIDELGGVVVSDHEGRITYNNTFRARLDRLDRQLLTVISSTIFGE